MPVPADFRTGFLTFSPAPWMSFLLCVSFPPACVPGHGGLVPCFPLRCTLLVHQHVPMCPSVRRELTGMGVCSPRPLDTASSASTLPDSPAGCVGLAANGAGPRRATPASVRTRDRRTEARRDCTSPQRQTTSEFLRCDLTTARWPPTRGPADGQQWAAHRKRG